VLTLDNPVAVTSQKDTLSLAIRLWLYDKSLSSLVVELISKTLGVRRQNPGLREEVVLIGKNFLHHAEVAS